MSRKKPQPYPERPNIAAIECRPPDGPCPSCSAPAVIKIVFCDVRDLVKHSVNFCEPHADAWAFKHYGPYLVLSNGLQLELG